MIVEIDTSRGIDWAAKGMARRIQNINNALNTYRYEVGFNRTFGKNPALVDLPMDKYIPGVVAETYELVPEVDEKAKVIEVTPVMGEHGELSLKVVVELE